MLQAPLPPTLSPSLFATYLTRNQRFLTRTNQGRGSISVFSQSQQMKLFHKRTDRKPTPPFRYIVFITSRLTARAQSPTPNARPNPLNPKREAPMRLLYLVFTLNFIACITTQAQLDDTTFKKLHKQLQPAKNEAWRTIPWKTAMLDAQHAAAAEQKPIFIWAMDGHPLGCT